MNKMRSGFVVGLVYRFEKRTETRVICRGNWERGRLKGEKNWVGKDG